MLPAGRFVNPAPLPMNRPLTVAMFPVTFNEVRVPTEVMFGCAAFTSVPMNRLLVMLPLAAEILAAEIVP